MIKIINNPIQKIKCNNCNCILSYEPEDIKTNWEFLTFLPIKTYYNYIRCPICKEKIILKWK